VSALAGTAAAAVPAAIPAARSRLATFRGKRMTFLSAHGGQASLVSRIVPRRAETALRRR